MSKMIQECTTNAKVWCRRFGVEHNPEKDGVFANQLAPTSNRRGAITLAAARAAKARGVTDPRERIVIGWTVAAMLISWLDKGVGAEIKTPTDPESVAVWGKYEKLIRTVATEGWNARAKEKANPSITNMILDHVRGRVR